ncbi:MAG: single-stranded DNA-binding protein [Alphaproteobacteria bacterium]|nr:single-stranded DNA-binding protein [Alphaproteobacteria bacterium]
MAGSLNKVCLLGNLGRDPEIRTMQNGKKVANFSIATSERWRGNDGQQQERTEWHRIVVFSEGLVGVIERYVKKGSKLYIEGQLQTRKWQDQSGQDRYSTEVTLQNFNSKLIMLDSRPNDGGGYQSAGQPDDMGNSNQQGGNYSQNNDSGQNNSGQGANADNTYNSAQDLDDDIPF